MVNTVSHGVNAPALLFALLLPVQDRFIWGVDVEDVLYLASVLGLWYLVGRALDRQRCPTERYDFTDRPWFNCLLMAWAVLLFVTGSSSAYEMTRTTNMYIHTYLNPNVWAIGLALVWSFVLFILPGQKLLRWIRRKRVDAGSAV